MQLILTAGDRLKYGFTTGLYEICIFGYKDTSSVAITPTEVITSGQYVADDGVTYTVNIPSTKAVQFLYTQLFLAQKANITIRVDGLTINSTITLYPPLVYYKVCASENPVNCFLQPAEINLTSGNLLPLTSTI